MKNIEDTYDQKLKTELLKYFFFFFSNRTHIASYENRIISSIGFVLKSVTKQAL